MASTQASSPRKDAFARATLPILIVVLVACPLASASDPVPAMVFVRVFGDVRVEFEKAWKEPFGERDVEVATGSGFVIAPSGLILTNHHVVNGARRVVRIQDEDARVTTTVKRLEVVVGSGDTRQIFEPWVAAQNAELDLAVLQVNASDLPYVPFGDSDAVEAGSATRVLGFPFGRRLEVGKRPGEDVVPEVTVTGGSLSAARADEEGATRFLQTDASVQPGSSGGPMLDEDGYLIAVVKMKVAAGRTEAGPGFGVPVNLVKDFLESHGLLSQLPTARLRPGVVQGLGWKKFGLELPDGLGDRSPARLRLDSGDSEGPFGVRVDRVATGWTMAELEEALVQGKALPDFVPSAAVSRWHIERGKPPRVLGTAVGTAPDGQPFRVEYAIADLGREKVVARFLAPPDDMAFNLSLVRRALEGLEAERLLTREVRSPLKGGFEPVPFPGVTDGPLLLPAGWVSEATTSASCDKAPAAEAGLAASPPGDFTVVLRALSFGRTAVPADKLVRDCGGSRAQGNSYVLRSSRLGVALVTWGVALPRGEETLLLEAEAPEGKVPFVRELFDDWIRQLASGRVQTTAPGPT